MTQIGMRVPVTGGRRVAVYRTDPARSGVAGNGGELSAGRRTIVFCHGAPGAGLLDPDPALTRARDVSLLAVDRPGYGGSDPVSGDDWATVTSAADDTSTVLDLLGIERVAVVGWSAGGRVAFALAARRPDLVDRVVVVATPAPDEEVPWVSAEQHELLDELRELAPGDAHSRLAALLRPVVPRDPFGSAALELLGATGIDESVLALAETRLQLGGMLRDSFYQGARGLAADIAGYLLRPWGFEPEAVEAKTLLLYGARDHVAGPRHGRWWQRQLPDARLEIVPRAGHLVLFPMWDRVLSHLVPRSERRPREVVEARIRAGEEFLS